MKTRRPSRFAIITLSVLTLSFLTLFYRSDSALTKSNSSAAMAPITVTKAMPTLTTDANGNGVVNPGDTLIYSITVANGATDATGVIFTDVLDSNLTLVPGSVNSTPIAGDDTYAVTGNVRIQVPDGAADLLSNDIDPDTGNNTGLTASGPVTTTQGGNLTVNANGSFSYNPPPGFTGTDTFTYTVTEASGATGTGTATLNVSAMIWFVQAGAAADGDGRLGSPFNCLTGAGCFSASANDPNDNIFLYTGTYTGGITLKSGQKLIGQGASALLETIAGITLAPNSDALPSTGGTRPTVTNSAGNGITLNSGNLIRGLNTSGSTFAIDDNGTVGALSISEMLINSTGGGFRADNAGTPTVVLDSVTTTGGANGINIASTSGGSFAVTGAATISNSTADSISLNGTTSTFAVGGLTQINTTADGFIGIHLQTGSGAVTFAGIQINGRRDKGIRISGGARNITTGAVDIDNTNSDAATALEIAAPTGGTISFGATTIDGNNTPGGTAIEVALAAASVSFAAGSAITNTGGIDFNVNSGAGNITYNGSITNTGQGMISISGRTGGTIDFMGNLSHTGASIPITAATNSGGTVIFSGATKTLNSSTRPAVDLANNAGATINFTNGGLDIDTTSGTGFSATGGGTINVTTGTNSNTIDTTTGTAVSIVGVSAANPTPLNISLTSVAANGGANGIILTNTSSTGSPGGFRVLGNSSGLCGGQVTGFPAVVTAPNSADCTGGTIQNTTGAGILLNNAAGISLNRLRVANGQDDGIGGTTVTGFTLASSLIENNGNAVNEAGLDFDNLHGTSSITNSVVRLSHENNVEVRNTTNNGSQATLTVTGSTINNASSKIQSDDGVLYEGTGTANMSITVSGCALFANRGDHLQAAGSNDTDMVANFTNNTLTGGHSLALGQDIVLNTGTTNSGASFTYDVNGNSINGAILSAITATLGTPSAGVTMQGGIRNNIIGTSGVAESGSVQSNGITFNQTGSGTLTSSVTNNQIRQWESRGISASAFDSTSGGLLNLTIQSNTILEGNAVDPVSGVGGREGIIVIAGSSTVGNTNTVCMQLGGAGALANNVNRGPEAVVSGEQDIRVRARSASTFRLPGYGGGAADTTAVQNFLAGMNTSSVDGVVGVVADKAATSTGFVGGAACTQPAFAAAFENENKTADNSENNLSFSNVSYKSPSEFMATIQPFDNDSETVETIAVEETAALETTDNPAIVTAQANAVSANLPATITAPAARSFNDYGIGGFIAAAWNALPAVDALFVPTVKAQDSDKTKHQQVAPEAGETVCVDGNTDTSSCAGGFTLPANKSTTITFRAVVNAGSTATSIPNTASAAGQNSNTVNTTVFQPVTITKSFNPTSIISGANSVVTLTLTNPNTVNQTAASFTDTLSNMSAAGGAVTGTCAGTTPNTLAANTTALSFSGITVPASSSCTVIFSVTSSTSGTHPNTTSAVATSQVPTGGAPSNTANLTVFNLPTISKDFSPTSIQSGGTSTVTLTLGNTNAAALTGASFTDTLTDMTAVGGAVGGTCTGMMPATLAAGATALSFTGITIPANNTCTVTFAVTSSTAGTRQNTTSGVTTTQTTVGAASNTANLTVFAPPTITKAFNPTSIASGGTSTVTLTLTNSNATTLTGASFTDTLTNMTAVGGAAAGTCGGASGNVLTAGATNLSFSGINIPANNNCTVTFDVTSTTAGSHPNTTSGITTDQTPIAGAVSNTVNLTVVAPPAITKSFSPTSVSVGGISTLTISITNPSANTVALTGVGVTDSFPTGMEVDATPAATNSCPTGSTFAPVAGATSITISGVTVPVNATCTFTVKVKGTTAGAKLNTTGNVSSTNGGTGATASATLTVSNSSYEADVSPRPSGDGSILPDDVVQVRRFQNMTDAADQTTDEFQRADSAPFATFGDGKILSDDVVQTRRYQNGTDPKQPASGPLTQAAPRPADAVDKLFSGLSETVAAGLQKTVVDSALLGNSREVRVENASGSAGQTVTANIRFNAVGNESEYGFIINYDSTILSNPVVGVGTAGTSVRSCNIAEVGQVNCSVGGFPNNNAMSSDSGIGEIAAGNNQLLITVTFTIAANAQPGSMPLTLSNVNASSDAPQLFFPTATNGMVTILAPTAAASQISGRVLRTDGRGVSKARLTITDQNGEVRSALTNPFGYYRFDDIAAGEIYVISVSHKQYRFDSKVINASENLSDVDFIASEISKEDNP